MFCTSIPYTNIVEITKIYSRAIDAACSAMHRQQLSIVDSESIPAIVKVECILRIQRDLDLLQRQLIREHRLDKAERN